MKFKSQLTEGVLLKRYFRFLALIVLKNNQKIIIRCPQLGLLHGCEILGSRIWFSNPTPLTVEYLHTWELVEVDDGQLVALNPEHTNTLVLEGIKRGIIQELQHYESVNSNAVYSKDQHIDILLKQGLDQAFVTVQAITWGNARGEGLFPNSLQENMEHLNKLITLKKAGHRAVLIYCVQHNGVMCVRPADQVNPEYGKLLKEAIGSGVEVLAYRTKITISGMTLDTRIPVLCSEDMMSG